LAPILWMELTVSRHTSFVYAVHGSLLLVWDY